MEVQNMAKGYWNRYEVDLTPKHLGAFGQLYFGYDPILQRKVAIKKLSSIESAKYEARVMAGYGAHEFLPQVYDFFTFGTDGYIVMEFIEGQRLGHHLKGRKREKGKAVRITMNILRGLRHLHKKGYLHTDIQPENILIHEDQSRTVKIVDFSSAVKKNRDGIWKGKPKGGTWEYMPPEQFEKNAILDDSSDVYAAAGVCVYLLTGQAPFLPDFEITGEDTVDKYRAECKTLHSYILECDLNDKSLKEILIKATHPNRKKRYRSAQELINALRPFG